MIKRLLLYLLLQNILFAVIYDYPSLWEKRELQIIEKQDLKSILDAGIRPYRFPSMENRSMSFKHVNVRVILPDGRKTPYFPIDIANIGLCEPGYLESIWFRSRRMTTEEGKFELLKWLEFLDKPKEEILEYCDELQKHSNTMNFKDPPNIQFEKIFDGGDYYVTFGISPTRGWDETMRIGMGFKWKPFKTQREYKSFDGPIPQPRGYEHISFEAPDKFGPDSMDDMLKYKQEYARLKGMPLPQNNVMPSIPQGQSIPLHEEYESAAKPFAERESTISTTEGKKANSLPWYIIGLVVLLVLLLFFLNWKSKR